MKPLCTLLCKAFLLLCCTISFAQNETSTVKTTVEDTYEVKTFTKTTKTTEETKMVLPPYTVTTKITTEPPKPMTDEEKKLYTSDKVVTKVTDVSIRTDKPVPTIQTDYSTFRKSNIYILKAEVKDNYYQYTYFDFEKDKKNNDVISMFALPITEKRAVSHFQLSGIWRLNAPVSLISVPFKIRPDIQDRGQKASTTTNVGVSIPIIAETLERLFADSGKSKHIFSLNFLIAPSLEEIDASNSNGKVTTKQNTIVISSGLTLTYMYNDIAFSAIPIAGDFGINSAGKNWVYNGRYWWGFGIGVTPTFLWRVFK